jgi:triacylglycerol esterase/lipase EstA (alpha/beta hydrolase family)
MQNKKVFFVIISIVALLAISVTASLSLVNAQPTPIKRTAAPTTSKTDPLPVLLIHGYRSNSFVWNTWEGLLRNDGIQFKAVNFINSDDECGSSADHARELNKIVKDFKRETGARQVNIVAHSKGGLDARVYLANSSIDEVANLIMIGTPNAGAPLASPNDTCSAAKDFIEHAPATEAPRNPHTQYYTIAGNWNPFLVSNCPPTDFLQLEQWAYWQLPKPNDGIVPMSSVESKEYFHNIGRTMDCHTNLLSDIEFEKAKPILVRG